MTGHEGPEGEQMYSSTFSSISALDGSGWSTPRTGRFTPGKAIPYLGGWVGPSAGWTGPENLAPTGIRSSDSPARSESTVLIVDNKTECTDGYVLRHGLSNGIFKYKFIILCIMLVTPF
jgi:hypothetical protein